MQIIVLLFALEIGAIMSFQFFGTDALMERSTKIKLPSQGSTYTDVVSNAEKLFSFENGEIINLSGQGLTEVPVGVFEKEIAEELNLSNNQLEGSLPAEVRHLQNLRVLDLSDNKFTGVPAEIGQLAKLEVLNLSGNPITGLPLELGNLLNLKVLDLSGTQYSKYDLNLIKKNLPESVIIHI